jgi:ferredoxin
VRAAAPIRATARLEVDWTRCDGHGVCAALLPSVITRDDWGYPLIDPKAAERSAPGSLNRVVTACPALALRRGQAGPDRRRR